MTDNEALDRVRKLLSLAKSDNVHEAAAALALAQKIIARHKIDRAVFSAEPSAAPAPSEKIEDMTLTDSTSTWRMRLASALAGQNACYLYYVPGQRVQIVGRRSDFETVKYMFEWLAKEIDRLAAAEVQGRGKTWSNNFRLGAVETLQRRLSMEKMQTEREAQAEAFARDGEAGLARINSALVLVKKDEGAAASWVKANLKMRRTSGPRSNYDPSARAAGRAAGGSISLSSRGSLGSGSRRLGS